jgi:hypothetical protein
MKLRTAFFTTLLMYSAHSEAMFCPSNFNQINLGDSIEKVQAQCGKPAVENKEESQVNQPQEWVYFLKLNPNDIGTVKVSFSFQEDKLIYIASNGVSIGSSAVCGPNVQLGATSKQVETACGKPAMINISNSPDMLKEQPPATQTITWKYNTPPPNTLIFENGILKARK